MQSLQVLEHEERIATMDAVDDEPFTTRAELPLQPEAIMHVACNTVRRRAITATAGRRKED